MRVSLKNIFLIAAVLVLVFGSSFHSFSQEFSEKKYYLVDSLILSDLSERDQKTLKKHLDAYHATEDDTLKLSKLNLLVEELHSNKWEAYNHVMYERSHEFVNRGDQLKPDELRQGRRYLAASINNKGFAINQKGNAWMAVDYYLEAVTIYKELEDQEGIAVCYLNSAAAYMAVGEVEKSNEMDILAMEMAKEIEKYDMVSIAYKNIAMKLMMNQFYDEALENALAGLKYAKLVNDKPNFEATANLGLGQIYSHLEEDSLASAHFDAALKYQGENSANETYATSLNAYCEYCLLRITRLRESGESADWLVDSTRNMLTHALYLTDLGGLTNTKIRTYMNMGRLYLKESNPKRALVYADSAWALTKNSDNLPKQKRASWTRYEALKELGRYKDALEMLEVHLSVTKKIDNSESIEVATRNQLKLQHELKATADSLEQKRIADVHEKELQNEKDRVEAGQKQMWFLYGGILLVAVFGFFMYNRFKVTSRQKGVIEDQKHNIEEAHQEITASINYAKRLQSAILPSIDQMDEKLGQNFIIFSPKDVVSGDFYWMQERNGVVLFAVADCTGHGVPGAMLSVVCSNTLNRCVKEFGITQPAEILNKTRELVIEALAVSGQVVQDGMDISLCSFDTNTRKLVFAGANNPLWLVKPGGNEIQEFKGNKQPVGLYDKMDSFQQINIPVEKGDRVYLFSDGFADQFGGDDGKKLKSKNMKQFILDSQDGSMLDQKLKLETEFSGWKGSFEQIDDVCVLGVKLEY